MILMSLQTFNTGYNHQAKSLVQGFRHTRTTMYDMSKYAFMLVLVPAVYWSILLLFISPPLEITSNVISIIQLGFIGWVSAVLFVLLTSPIGLQHSSSRNSESIHHLTVGILCELCIVAIITQLIASLQISIFFGPPVSYLFGMGLPLILLHVEHGVSSILMDYLPHRALRELIIWGFRIMLCALFAPYLFGLFSMMS